MIATIIFTLLSALYDNGKRFINHTPRFIFRAIVVAIISYFGSDKFIFNFVVNTAIFYLLFDYTLNILEGRKWNYTGNTAKWDIVKGKIEKVIPYFDIISKIIFLIITYKLEWILKFLVNGPFGLWYYCSYLQ
jgi:hypothetical protein